MVVYFKIIIFSKYIDVAISARVTLKLTRRLKKFNTMQLKFDHLPVHVFLAQ